MAELDRDPELIASLTSSDLAAPLTACSGHRDRRTRQSRRDPGSGSTVTASRFAR